MWKKFLFTLKAEICSWLITSVNRNEGRGILASYALKHGMANKN